MIYFKCSNKVWFISFVGLLVTILKFTQISDKQTKAMEKSKLLDDVKPV
jgi:hypothetical protein